MAKTLTRGQTTPARAGSLRSERLAGGGGVTPSAQDSAGRTPGEIGYNPRTDPLSTQYVGDVTPGSQAYAVRVQAGWTGITADNKLIAKTPAEVPGYVQAVPVKPVYKISGKVVSPEEYAVKKGLARGEFEQQFISQAVLKAGVPRAVKGVMTVQEKALAERLIREREQARELTIQLKAQPSVRPVKEVVTKEKVITKVKKPFSLKTLLISPSYYFNIKDLIKGIPSFLLAEKQAQLKIGEKLKEVYELPGKKAEELRLPYETEEDLALKRKVEGLEYQTTIVRKRAAQRAKEQLKIEEDLRKYEENLRIAAEGGDQERYNKALSLYESKYKSYTAFVSQSRAKSTAEFEQVQKDLEKFNVQFEKKPVKVSEVYGLIGVPGISVKTLIERYGKTSEYEEKRAARIKAATPFMIKVASTALDVGPEFALGLLLPQEAALMYGRYAIGKLGYQAVIKPEETFTGLYKQAKYSPEKLAGPPLAFAGGILTRQYLISKLSREELILKNFEEKISKQAIKTQDLNLNKLLSDMREGYFIEYKPKPIKISELLKEKLVKIPVIQDIIKRTSSLVNRISSEVKTGIKEGILEKPVITEMTPAVIKKAEIDLYKAYSPARMDWLTKFEQGQFKVFVSVKELARISGYKVSKAIRGKGIAYGQLYFPFGKPRIIEAAKLEPYDILKFTGKLRREFSITEPSIKKLPYKVKSLTKELILPKKDISTEFLKQETGIVSYKDVTYYMTKKRFAELLNKMEGKIKEVIKEPGRVKGVVYKPERISMIAKTSDDIIKNVLSKEEAVIDLQVSGLKWPSERGLEVVKKKPGKAGVFDIKEIDFKKVLRLSEPAKKLTGPSVKQIRAKLKATLGKYYEPELKYKTFFTEGYERGLTVFKKPLELFKVKKTVFTVFKKAKTEIKPYEPKLEVTVGKGGQVQILKQELKLKPLKQELKLKPEGKIKVVNIKEYLKRWEEFKETVKQKLKRKQREKEAQEMEAQIITGVQIVEPFVSKFKARVKTVFETGRIIKVKAKQRLDEASRQERRIASLIRQSDLNLNRQLFGQAEMQAFKQAEKQAQALFQPSAQEQPQAITQLEDQIIQQDTEIIQDLIQIQRVPELIIGRKFKPERPKKPPFLFKLELEEEVKKKVDQKAFNVFVRRRKAWSMLNKEPLDLSAAFNLGGSNVDNTAAVSFKLVQAKQKISQRLIQQSINNAFKFRAYRHKGRTIPMTPKLIEERMALKRSGVFIEDNKYRIDSPGEMGEIRVKGVNINKIVGGLLK